MRSPLSSRRPALAFALGTLLALPSVPASASAFAPGARKRSEQLLGEGDAASTAKRWDEAISKYRAAYYGLPPEDQAAYVGSLTVRKAMRAYQERITQEEDPSQRKTLLQRQGVLLDEFLAAVAAKPGAAEELGEDVIAELEETRRSIDAALADPKPEPEPEPDDAGTTTTDPERDPADPSITTPTTPTDHPEPTTKPARDWLGLGLVIGGSVTLATGLGVGAGRWVLRANAQQLVDAGGEEYAPGTDARAEYLAGEYARADKFLIAGGVVAGVGLATTIGGIVRIFVHRRRTSTPKTTTLHLAPVLSPTTAGLVLHRRF